MATAYTAELTFVGKRVYNYHVTASDVNGEYYINTQDGSSDFVFAEACQFTDIIFSTTAGTTNRVSLQLNGVDSGIILAQNANQATTVNRPLTQRSLGIPGGSKLRFKMVT